MQTDRATEGYDSPLSVPSCKICRVNTAFSFYLLIADTHHPVFHQATRDGRAGEDKDWKNTIQPESSKKSNLEDKQVSAMN